MHDYDHSTVFKNHSKILITSEASYVYNLRGQKFIKNGQFLASFWKPEACGQTVLPERPISMGQKLVKNAKSEKFKWDILGDFQTVCFGFSYLGMEQLRPEANFTA